MTNVTDATVLLAGGLDAEGKLIEVRGTPFYRDGSTIDARGSTVFTGLADAVQAVQEAGLVRAPAYWLAQGRVAAIRAAMAKGDVMGALQESVWGKWHDVLGDTDVFELEKSYPSVASGVHVVDVVNGTLFSHDHERVRDSVLQRNGQQLQQGAVQLTSKDAGLLFGEGMVYAWKDGRMQPVKAQLYHSGAEFLEASADPGFLDNDPVYAVVRPVEEAAREPSGYQDISVQLGNTDLAIRLGGKQLVRDMLVDEEGRQHFGWTQVGSHHKTYAGDVNGGRRVIVNIRSNGVNCDDYANNDGRPVGVAPEALAARKKIVAPLPLEVAVAQEAAAQQERTFPESHVRRLLSNHFSCTVGSVEKGIQVLGSYSTKKQ